jgi:hypothetical protein
MCVSAGALEAFLAAIYVDSVARDRFVADPYAEAKRVGLSESECAAVLKMDFVGLAMASRSFAAKRKAKNANVRLPRMAQISRSLLSAFKRVARLFS